MDEPGRYKRRWSLLPWLPLVFVVDAMEVGAAKYGAGNWQTQTRDTYWDAAQRHLMAYKFTRRDAETGLPHAAHAAANILILLALDIQGGFHGSDKEIVEGACPKGTQRPVAEACDKSASASG